MIIANDQQNECRVIAQRNDGNNFSYNRVDFFSTNSRSLSIKKLGGPSLRGGIETFTVKKIVKKIIRQPHLKYQANVPTFTEKNVWGSFSW